ncbi:ketoacyl-ACP synthase III [Bacillaceae bacterium SIJ1]|uniref:ketoacyl-ACP synthase III n=1 Tax=Litoribacterium kuwaitense TaxID=1398745 RepID=UPI0013EE3680|nr:ketoacyl-ACP synthase III [Litoribacterium kuwaitense]NGP45228.1 ketoacyl-ACP synthase III [Litoribacterium kuwaitense]
MLRSQARLTAIGAYVPEKRLTNADLESMVETSDEWIVQRTGMRERRIAGENEFTSHLCIEAVQSMIDEYGVHVDDVDHVIVATTTPDYAFPSVACQVQNAFGIQAAGALDLNATCAGFTYGLHMANGLISSGLHRKILVIGGETLSKVTDYRDRSTCILFGDGAGAALVEYDPALPSFLGAVTGSDGSGGQHVYRTGLSSVMDDVPLSGEGRMVQNGREVYKWAVRMVPGEIETLLERAALNKQDVDWFVPHSANLRMIESICEKAQMPFEQTLYSVVHYGNTSSASIPLALYDAVKEKRLREGDKVVLFGFGGGLTYCGLALTWGA